MKRLIAISTIVIASLLVGAIASYLLLLLSAVYSSSSRPISVVVGSVIVGLAFVCVGWPVRYISEKSWTDLGRSNIRRERDITNLIGFFHLLYGALIFYIVGKFAFASVFGMDFTTSGQVGFARGNMYLIALTGGLFGVYLFAFAHFDRALTSRNRFGITQLSRIIGGGVFSVVGATLTGSPFFVIVFGVCVTGSIIASQFNSDQLAFISICLLILCFVLLPMTAYLSIS